MHTHIVKRGKGHREPYDNHKVYASCYAACLNAGLSRNEAENVSQKVMTEVDRWIDEKETVTSKEIFEEVSRDLEKHNRSAAFLYKTHRDIS